MDNSSREVYSLVQKNLTFFLFFVVLSSYVVAFVPVVACFFVVALFGCAIKVSSRVGGGGKLIQWGGGGSSKSPASPPAKKPNCCGSLQLGTILIIILLNASLQLPPQKLFCMQLPPNKIFLDETLTINNILCICAITFILSSICKIIKVCRGMEAY